jgi:hypothetical protein
MRRAAPSWGSSREGVHHGWAHGVVGAPHPYGSQPRALRWCQICGAVVALCACRGPSVRRSRSVGIPALLDSAALWHQGGILGQTVGTHGAAFAWSAWRHRGPLLDFGAIVGLIRPSCWLWVLAVSFAGSALWAFGPSCGSWRPWRMGAKGRLGALALCRVPALSRGSSGRLRHQGGGRIGVECLPSCRIVGEAPS